LFEWFPLNLARPAEIGRYKNQNVAMKIVHKGDTPEEITKREGRFLREVTMLSRVQHNNLVKVVLLLNLFVRWMEAQNAF
jgi:hypothetical protein